MICDVMVSVLASSAINRGFEPRSGQIQDHNIGICCFSAKHAVSIRKRNDWLARNQIICPSEATCQSAECCFSELALNNPTKRVGLTLVQSGPHSHLIDN